MKVLVIPRMKILNANALSSPYTIGFPAMTAWLGGVHALQRKLRGIEEFEDICLKSVGVVCHKIDLQTFKGRGDYDSSIIGTGNPLNKRGERSSFIEEPRCHLTVSLVVECIDEGLTDFDDFSKAIDNLLRGGMKFAGGDIISLRKSQYIEISDKSGYKKLTAKLMPGFCLIERKDLMIEGMNQGLDCLDSILEYLKVSHTTTLDEKGNVHWEMSRKEKGWIVPIATGYHGITELGKVHNQRDNDTPHRFAESIVTLGEFIMPYRIEDIDEMLWQYDTDIENSLYICKQKKEKVKIGDINGKEK